MPKVKTYEVSNVRYRVVESVGSELDGSTRPLACSARFNEGSMGRLHADNVSYFDDSDMRYGSGDVTFAGVTGQAKRELFGDGREVTVDLSFTIPGGGLGIMKNVTFGTIIAGGVQSGSDDVRINYTRDCR